MTLYTPLISSEGHEGTQRKCSPFSSTFAHFVSLFVETYAQWESQLLKARDRHGAGGGAFLVAAWGWCWRAAGRWLRPHGHRPCQSAGWCCPSAGRFRQVECRMRVTPESFPEVSACAGVFHGSSSLRMAIIAVSWLGLSRSALTGRVKIVAPPASPERGGHGQRRAFQVGKVFGH